jgi:hypothetical protein
MDTMLMQAHQAAAVQFLVISTKSTAACLTLFSPNMLSHGFINSTPQTNQKAVTAQYWSVLQVPETTHAQAARQLALSILPCEHYLLHPMPYNMQLCNQLYSWH